MATSAAAHDALARAQPAGRAASATSAALATHSPTRARATAQVWKHFGTDLDPRTVVHAWLSSGALIDATSKGYRAIWSVDGQYYLDALGETWEGFYNVDVLRGVTNASAIPLILGGECVAAAARASARDARILTA
jgi:hypothetical protein